MSKNITLCLITVLASSCVPVHPMPGYEPKEHSPAQAKPPATQPPSQWADIDDTIGSVENFLTRVAAECKQHCVPSNKPAADCFKACIAEYARQRESFLVRKYTSQCMGQAFNELFSYRKTERARAESKNSMRVALEHQSRNSLISTCVQVKLLMHQELVNSAQRYSQIQAQNSKSLRSALEKGILESARLDDELE